MAISWVCCGDLALEGSVTRKSRGAGARFGVRATYLLRGRSVRFWTRYPSWRQRRRPQLTDPSQDLSEQVSGDGDLCELEGDAAAMSHDLGADLDELVLQRGQGPVFDSLGQGQSS